MSIQSKRPGPGEEPAHPVGKGCNAKGGERRIERV